MYNNECDQIRFFFNLNSFRHEQDIVKLIKEKVKMRTSFLRVLISVILQSLLTNWIMLIFNNTGDF